MTRMSLRSCGLRAPSCIWGSLGVHALLGTAASALRACIAIAIIIAFPAICTWFPEHLQAESRAVKTEEVDDSMNRLEEDPLKAIQPQNEEEDAKK